jgi:lauroyl/myristoyl acyltransferase
MSQNASDATPSANIIAEPKDRLHRFKHFKRLFAMLPYRHGATLFAFLTHCRLVQFLARRHRNRLLAYMREYNLDLPLRDVFARYLNSSFLAAWRLASLANCDDEEFARWVKLSGYEHFQEPRDVGRPVILCHSHYGAGKSMLLALIRKGHVIHSVDREDVFSFYNIQARGKMVSINLGAREQSFYLKQVFRSRNVLMDGGVLHIAADGLRGTSFMELPFLNRLRRFPTSLAELALATNAVIVPVLAVVNDDGGVLVEFLPALKMPAPETARTEGVAFIVSQYRDLLESRWLSDPGSVHKGEFAIWAKLPYTRGSLVPEPHVSTVLVETAV